MSFFVGFHVRTDNIPAEKQLVSAAAEDVQKNPLDERHINIFESTAVPCTLERSAAGRKRAFHRVFIRSVDGPLL